MAARVIWIDAVKGLAIILMVFGHVLQGVQHAGLMPADRLYILTNRFIYSFHMQTFFLVSGLFVAYSISKGYKQYLADKFKVVVWPYFFWTLLSVGLAAVFTQFYNNPEAGDINRLKYILWEPIGGFWFFYVLFCLQLFALVTHTLPRWIVFAASVLAFLFSPKFNVVAIDSFVFYLPFFIAGQLIAPKLSCLNQLKQKTLLVIVVTCLAYQSLTVINGLSAMPLIHLSLGFSGALMLAATAMLSAPYACFTTLRSLGIASLGIYVVHAYFQGAARATLSRVLDISDPLTHVILGTVLGIIGSVIVWRFCFRFGLYWLFMLRKPALYWITPSTSANAKPPA